ncbi:MAG TPA: DUF4331 domain-containing protein [Bryobacteraceae bacterium]|nr:DUF4331 domain-containing protein [Bryobacteraceae bacterium]
MTNKLKSFACVTLAATLAAPPSGFAASHREAPITALDHKADITDFFAFVSYNDSTKVTFILNVDPLLEPGNGPNYFPFDDNILYTIKVDNNNDAVEDITFQVQFRTEVRAPQVFTGFVGAGGGLNAPANSPPPVAPGSPVVPPAITALDGPGAAGLSLRQSYSVTMVKNGVSTPLTAGSPLYTVPSNVGPRTMPNYPLLAAQGIYELGSGIKVFAGTVDDPFYIDLGAAFDSLNFRQGAGGGVLSPASDANDQTNFAPDFVSGFNVNTIAIEVPVAALTRTGSQVAASDPAATIGAWGATYRPRTTVRRAPLTAVSSGSYSQVQRMGNPLINELIIGTGSKDFWSMSQPKDDAQFANFALDPLLARVLNAIYGIQIPTPPRTDLLPLVTYAPPIAAPGTPAGPVADLLRLNTGVAPTPGANRRRLGLLAGDAAGFPNGRRVSDDVTDIAARAVAGILAGPTFNYRIGDGVNTNDVPYQEVFPYVAFALSGRDRRHIDPGEAGCTMNSGNPCPVN